MQLANLLGSGLSGGLVSHYKMALVVQVAGQALALGLTTGLDYGFSKVTGVVKNAL